MQSLHLQNLKVVIIVATPTYITRLKSVTIRFSTKNFGENMVQWRKLHDIIKERHSRTFGQYSHNHVTFQPRHHTTVAALATSSRNVLIISHALRASDVCTLNYLPMFVARLFAPSPLKG